MKVLKIGNIICGAFKLPNQCSDILQYNVNFCLLFLIPRFIYMLGKDTWVERWPSTAECSSNQSLRAKCSSLDDAARELSVDGCRQ